MGYQSHYGELILSGFYVKSVCSALVGVVGSGAHHGLLTIGQAIGDCQTSLQHFALIMIFLPQPKQNKYKNHQFLFQIRIAPIPINSI